MSASEPRVAIVGAGLAGLAAASELRRRGLPVVVLEREAQSGGRARSERVEGFPLEPLAPVLSTRDRELLGWIADLGMQDELLPLRPVLTGQVHRGAVAPLDARGLRDLLRVRGLRMREGLRLLRLPRLLRRYAAHLDPEAPEKGAPLDDRSLGDFARLYFGRSVLERWMGPLVGASLAEEERTSRVNFLLRHRRHHGGRRGLPRAPLSELAEAASRTLPMLLDARVTGVVGRRSGPVLRYTREGRERELEASAVVLATPADESARIGAELFTSGERELLAGVRYAAGLTLAAATCRPLSWHALEIRVPAAEGSPLGSALLEPGMKGSRVPDGYGVVSLQARPDFAERTQQLPDETLVKELLEAFEAIQPGARAAVTMTRIFRTPRALPGFDVGHYRALARLARIGSERRAEGRRLYLAGDYRSEASWNGAVASGLRAAREVAADLLGDGA